MDKMLNVSSVAFTIGDFEVYWYGIIMCLAIVIAILVATWLCKVKKYNTEMPIDIAYVIVPAGILCARLFSVIFEPELNMSDYFNFRTGGMSIIGAVIGGAIGLSVYLLIKKPKEPLLYFDTLVVVLILAQAIGRWGNYFNQEVYGQMVDPEWVFCFFPMVVEINGVFYQALFFYESALNLIGFLMLAICYICSKKRGLPTALYLVYYGAVRTFLEMFRQEEYILRLGGIAISRLFSILMIVAGVALFITIMVNSKKKKSKLRGRHE